MERIIKFKAKRLSDGKWVKGDLYHNVRGFECCIGQQEKDDVYVYPVDPSTVCQYTGLKDMKGREIWKHESVSMLGTYAFMNVFGNFVCFGIDAAKGRRDVRLATEEEKLKLYNALAKEGKRWNPDDKKIENLPQKYKFKMFDKVLGRKHDGFWSPAIYIHYDTNRNEHYVFDIAFGVNVWVEECISFEKNEEIAFVIGNEKEDNNHE